MASFLNLSDKPSAAIEQAAKILMECQESQDFLNKIQEYQIKSNGEFSALSCSVLYRNKQLQESSYKLLGYSFFKLAGLRSFEKGFLHSGLINFGIKLLAKVKGRVIIDVIPQYIDIPLYPVNNKALLPDFYSELKKIYLTLRQKEL